MGAGARAEQLRERADLALHLVGRWCGTDIEAEVATELEYEPDPSRVFVAGEPDE